MRDLTYLGAGEREVRFDRTAPISLAAVPSFTTARSIW